ncbi:FKBP12-associated protein 1-like protein [Smittium culicis]|uniref:FKBP12-associated protein 1-like protein n=1 Tax=Smittium culicis TaxID=133412 RepID=A0A1R1Y9M2_9FUNG|nr:FKBP12-associated protein 1-like protein [Smittium culicis]
MKLNKLDQDNNSLIKPKKPRARNRSRNKADTTENDFLIPSTSIRKNPQEDKSKSRKSSRENKNRNNKTPNLNIDGFNSIEPRERTINVETEVDKSRQNHLKWLFDRQKNSKTRSNRGIKSFGSGLSTSISTYNKDSPENTDSNITSKGENSRSRRKIRNMAIISSSLTMSKSIEASLINNTLECLICYEIISRSHHVWSCDECYSIMHLHCVSTWAKGSASVEASNKPTEKKWRCPGCQKKRINIPISGHCFCQKFNQPIKYENKGRIPHSCNQICGKVLNCSFHTCPEYCHPGKCTNCTITETVNECYCGKLISLVKCDGSNQLQPLRTCGQICNKALNCKVHFCKNICHSGACMPCNETSMQSCYCGKENRLKSVHSPPVLECWAVTESGISQINGSFSCTNTCAIPFDCNAHFCLKECHPHELNVLELIPLLDPCPYKPENLDLCSCGKTSLISLGAIRAKCTDPIPTCSEICGKILKCGHSCNSKCHNGNCAPCEEMISTFCKCRRDQKLTKCGSAKSGNTFECSNVCKHLLNCKRHQCELVCCLASNPNYQNKKPNSKPKPSKSKKKKKVNFNEELLRTSSTQDFTEIFIPESIKRLHYCSKICDKKLNCNLHKCQATCHQGQCQPCKETYESSLSCPCGMTRMGPPLLCGSILPKCNFYCNKVRECGHYDSTYHDCHPEGTSCPPCPFYVSKACQCDKKIMVSNIPCSRINVYCGQVCGKLLDCGSHYCELTCHPADVKCLSLIGNKCKSRCLKPRKCGHECKELCHAPSKCPEGIKCNKQITVTCTCGNLSKSIDCTDYVMMKSLGNEFLECTELCKMLVRNKALAEALDLPYRFDSSLDEYKHVEYDEQLVEFGLKNKKFLQDIETAAAGFVSDSKRWNYWFAPMRRDFRHFLHLLAPYYNCNSASVDMEPKRNVCWTKRKLNCSLPIYPLSVVCFSPDQIKSTKINPDTGIQHSDAGPNDKRILVPVSSDVYNALLEKENEA